MTRSNRDAHQTGRRSTPDEELSDTTKAIAGDVPQKDDEEFEEEEFGELESDEDEPGEAGNPSKGVPS